MRPIARALLVTRHTASAGVLALGLAALPARTWPVDAPAGLLLALELAAATALVARRGERIVQIACIIAIAVGLAAILALALSVAFLRGVYGPIGQGGQLVFVLVIALIVPYALVLPGLELAKLRP